MPVTGISVLGRATMGVRLMRLKEGDKVSAVARLLAKSEEERLVEKARTITTCPTENGDVADKNEDDGEGESGGDEDSEEGEGNQRSRRPSG